MMIKTYTPPEWTVLIAVILFSHNIIIIIIIIIIIFIIIFIIFIIIFIIIIKIIISSIVSGLKNFYSVPIIHREVIRQFNKSNTFKVVL